MTQGLRQAAKTAKRLDKIADLFKKLFGKYRPKEQQPGAANAATGHAGIQGETCIHGFTPCQWCSQPLRIPRDESVDRLVAGWLIVISDSANRGRYFPVYFPVGLERREYRIGTDLGCEILLNDPANPLEKCIFAAVRYEEQHQSFYISRKSRDRVTTVDNHLLEAVNAEQILFNGSQITFANKIKCVFVSFIESQG